jgi:hypothetical protein
MTSGLFFGLPGGWSLTGVATLLVVGAQVTNRMNPIVISKVDIRIFLPLVICLFSVLV